MKISPRTSNNSGAPPGNRCGSRRIVFTFSVTSSPVVPSPRVAAYLMRPFS